MNKELPIKTGKDLISFSTNKGENKMEVKLKKDTSSATLFSHEHAWWMVGAGQCYIEHPKGIEFKIQYIEETELYVINVFDEQGWYQGSL